MVKSREEIKAIIASALNTDAWKNASARDIMYGLINGRIDSNQHWLESDVQGMLDEILNVNS